MSKAHQEAVATGVLTLFMLIVFIRTSVLGASWSTSWRTPALILVAFGTVLTVAELNGTVFTGR